VFYDAGQVFPSIRDFAFRMRHAVGVGLRYASPFGLVRFDVGFPLGRKEGEKRFQLILSLGQAF
jgi:translocation and assembly module TamA